MARGKKDLSASDRAESERLLQQLTGHRMAGIAAVVAQVRRLVLETKERSYHFFFFTLIYLTCHEFACNKSDLNVSSVHPQNQSYNEAKRSALELRLSELTSRQQEIKGALREVHEGSLGA